MFKFYTAIFALFFCTVLQAQVGIGTTSPKAMLDINAETDLPALELNPQSTPLGSVTGQLAVIEDRLYLYDQERGKWLSVETTLLNFGREKGNNNVFLEYVGDIQNIGALMPQAGTIVYVTLNSSGGASNKKFEIHINGVPVPNNDAAMMESVDGELELVSGNFRSTIHNIDFELDDLIRVKVANDGRGNVDNATALLWVKWRK